MAKLWERGVSQYNWLSKHLVIKESWQVGMLTVFIEKDKHDIDHMVTEFHMSHCASHMLQGICWEKT